MLKDMNLLSGFRALCIETLLKEGKPIPPVTEIPALVIPEFNKILQGRETFIWLNSIQESMQKVNMSNIDKLKNSDKVHGFNNNEMTGVSDDFVYLHTDAPQPKEFMPYGKDSDYTIYTGEIGKKLNSIQTKKLLQMSQKERNEFDTDIKLQNIDKQQNAVISKSKQKLNEN